MSFVWRCRRCGGDTRGSGNAGERQVARGKGSTRASRLRRTTAVGWTRASGPPDCRHAGAGPASSLVAPSASRARRASSAGGSCSTRRCSRPDRSRCSGNVHETAAQVVAQAGLAGHPPLLDVNAGAAAPGIEQLPWVRTGRRARVVARRRPHRRDRGDRPLRRQHAGGQLGDAERRRSGARRVARPPAGTAAPDGAGAARRARRACSPARTRAGAARWPSTLPPSFAAQVTAVDGGARGLGAADHDDADRGRHRVRLRSSPPNTRTSPPFWRGRPCTTGMSST